MKINHNMGAMNSKRNMKINNKKEPLRLFFIYRKIVLNKKYK